MRIPQPKIGERLRRASSFAAGLLACAYAAAGAAQPPEAARRAELANMVRQDCGSCHGMTLKGGLGPALTPEALRDKPANGLAVTILAGRPGSAMPPWRDFVSQAEADWIVEQLRKGTVDVR
jgi:cytochrome c55X